MDLLHTEQTSFATVITNWIFFALAIFVVMMVTLTEVNLCESTSFCATSIFMFVWTGSFIMLIALYIISQNAKEAWRGKNVLLFFLQGITTQKLVWIPIGLAGVLLISYLSTSIDQPYGSYIGIIGSGMIMLVAFYATNAILIPILIHGIYNSIVVTLQTDFGTIFIPAVVGGDFFSNFFTQIGLGDYFTQVFFQIAVVANAEEFFKVFVIAFILVSTKGKFATDSGSKWVAGIFSVLIWAVYHSIASI